jgi:hypothetical protein
VSQENISLVGTEMSPISKLTRAKRLVSARQGRIHVANANSFADAALRYDEQMRDLFGVPAISPASRLLLFMMAHDSVSIKQAMLAVPLSYRAFYSLLDVLKYKALVSVENDANDGRVRRLVLGAAFKKIEPSLIAPNQPG